MKTIECVHCDAFFDCKGKPTKEPCVNFVENKENPLPDFHEILQKEMGKSNGNK